MYLLLIFINEHSGVLDFISGPAENFKIVKISIKIVENSPNL
jgi:hypothetical protein